MTADDGMEGPTPDPSRMSERALTLHALGAAAVALQSAGAAVQEAGAALGAAVWLLMRTPAAPAAPKPDPDAGEPVTLGSKSRSRS